MSYRIDLFSVFIFLGIVQGIFLLFFFLSKENRKREANRFHAILLFALVACTLEIFLMYTDYIINCLHLVDYSESFSFLIGPSFYLLVVSLIRGPVPRSYYWHFAFAGLYLLMQIPFFILPEDCKYNAYVAAYRPDLSFRDVTYDYDPYMFFFTEHHSRVTLISLLVYGLLCLWEVIKAFKSKKESFFKAEHPTLRSIRSGTIQILLSFLIIITVKLLYKNDYGDHWIAAYVTLSIYFTSFTVIKNSGFFNQASLNDQKYKNSTLSSVQRDQLLSRLDDLMKNEKPFLKSEFSLPDLAYALKTSVHIVSQTINDGLNKSFFEMVAEYRVEAARKFLIDQPNVKVEQIAELVGYNSKSSFNTAFRKLTGMTPSEYRQRHKV